MKARIKHRPRVRVVKYNHIKQGEIGSCALLAGAPDSLLYRKESGSQVAFKFYDRLTGAGEWVRVKGNFGPDPRKSSALIEQAYGKWLKNEGIYDETGATGIEAVGNGNYPDEVIRDITGIDSKINFPYISALEGKEVMLGSSGETTHFVANHAYRVIGASNESISIFNPWGIDGRQITGANDGIITLSLSDFVKEFRGWGYSF
jgi:hypothetical protein